MPFLGTLVNFAAVLIFGIIGSLAKKGIPKRVSDTLMSVIGICIAYIGIEGALEAAPTVSEDSFFSAGLIKIMVMLLSIVVGTLIGELVDIDKWMNKLGAFAAKKLTRDDGNDKKFAKGFVSCTILFCVGAMAINGSIADAVGSPDILLAKSVIDALSVLVMSSTLGIGCAFSAFSVLLYQGALTLLALFFTTLVSAATLTYMSVTGSLVIILIGTNMLGMTHVKTANMTPAIFLPMLFGPLLQMLA